MAKAEKKEGNSIIETIKTVVYALLIAGVFRTLFFQPFWIPSGSMKETLLIGDFLFVNKMAYGYSYASCPSIKIQRLGIDLDGQKLCGVFDGDNGRFWAGEPDRGDVVVFRHPTNGTDYIKRLVGLPGDKVQVTNGIINLNGVPVPQVPVGNFTEKQAPQGPHQLSPRCANGPVGAGGVCEKERYQETFPEGNTHVVLNTFNQPGSPDNTKVFAVPEGHYFFMGDNRDNSNDSRVSQLSRGVGFVPYENLIGRADRIMFSSAGRSMLFVWTWRGDRFFKAVD
ncbi:MAG: signal peptidase I [Ascidiaceihabitans sp.]|nr:signal peptidase I [Ascidiaceihabitans sp.]